MGKHLVFWVLTLTACDAGTEATPDPTSNQGGAAPTSAVSGSAANASASSTATGSTGSAMAGEETDGARLSVRYIGGDDGSKTRQGIWDSQLQTLCEWRQAADGALRCLPSGAWEETALLFSDGTCSQRVAVIPCGQESTYVVATEPSCNATWRVYQRGGEAAGGAYYRNSFDQCTNAAVPSQSKVFLLTEVATASFASGAVQ